MNANMNANNDVEAVVTSFNQKSMIYEAVSAHFCRIIAALRHIYCAAKLGNEAADMMRT